MRFLLDQNRSPQLAVLLRQAGHDALHTHDVGLADAEDDHVLAAADEQDRVLVTGDTDFGALSALLHRTSPSVILFRARNLPQAHQQAAVLLNHLPGLSEDLARGAVVVVGDDRIRIRRLPLLRDQ